MERTTVIWKKSVLFEDKKGMKENKVYKLMVRKKSSVMQEHTKNDEWKCSGRAWNGFTSKFKGWWKKKRNEQKRN